MCLRSVAASKHGENTSLKYLQILPPTPSPSENVRAMPPSPARFSAELYINRLCASAMLLTKLEPETYKSQVRCPTDSATTPPGTYMGVDHGGGTGDDANTNCPPSRFCHIGTKMSVLWPSKYAKIRFRGGAHDAPQTP